jgi:hypothetical protein
MRKDVIKLLGARLMLSTSFVWFAVACLDIDCLLTLVVCFPEFAEVKDTKEFPEFQRLMKGCDDRGWY